MSEPSPVTCEEALRLLADYLDRELHAESRETLERHLATCRSCYSRAEFERRLKDRIGTLGREEIPGAFERRVRNLLAGFTHGGTDGRDSVEPA